MQSEDDIALSYVITKYMKHFFLILNFIFFIESHAQALDAADYSEMAKNKTYRGGAEESDLKLLPESYFQKNKKNNSEEVNEGF